MRSELWRRLVDNMKRRFWLLVCISLLFVLLLPAAAKTGFSHGERDKKRIALSFDDGPHPRLTPQILSILEKYDISATFFMIGCNVVNYPEIAKAVYRKGHEIGNHTFTHPHMKSLTTNALKEEVEKTERALADIGIPRPKLFRPPEGFRSCEQVAALTEAGYQTIIWSLDTHDWQGRAASDIVSGVLQGVQGGDVLLFHDYTTTKNTITALEQLIPKLLEDGYEFVTVSDLMC